MCVLLGGSAHHSYPGLLAGELHLNTGSIVTEEAKVADSESESGTGMELLCGKATCHFFTSCGQNKSWDHFKNKGKNKVKR